jgi:hypothetical protein
MTILDAPTTTHWRKSTYTAQGGADCVEVAALSYAICARDAASVDNAGDTR